MREKEQYESCVSFFLSEDEIIVGMIEETRKPKRGAKDGEKTERNFFVKRKWWHVSIFDHPDNLRPTAGGVARYLCERRVGRAAAGWLFPFPLPVLTMYGMG